jgi:hypothetical protein
VRIALQTALARQIESCSRLIVWLTLFLDVCVSQYLKYFQLCVQRSWRIASPSKIHPGFLLVGSRDLVLDVAAMTPLWAFITAFSVGKGTRAS